MIFSNASKYIAKFSQGIDSIKLSTETRRWPAIVKIVNGIVNKLLLEWDLKAYLIYYALASTY